MSEPYPPQTPNFLKYERNHAFQDSRGNKCDLPNPETERDVQKFLERMGYNKFEGGSSEEHQTHYKRIIDKYGIKKIMEIGFNTGASADMFLSADPEAIVASFDIMIHAYCRFGKIYIDTKHPGRHQLLCGDSNQAIPGFHAQHPDSKFDLLFVDGDHRYKPALNDIKNCKKLAHENSILIIDNISPHRGAGYAPYYAWKKLIEEGYLKHIEHVEVGENFDDGFAVCQYVFNKTEESEEKEAAVEMPNWEHIERKLPVAEIMREMNDATTMKTLDSIIAKLEVIREKTPEIIDDWCDPEIKKHKLRISTGGGVRSRSWRDEERTGGRDSGRSFNNNRPFNNRPNNNSYGYQNRRRPRDDGGQYYNDRHRRDDFYNSNDTNNDYNAPPAKKKSAKSFKSMW